MKPAADHRLHAGHRARPRAMRRTPTRCATASAGCVGSLRDRIRSTPGLAWSTASTTDRAACGAARASTAATTASRALALRTDGFDATGATRGAARYGAAASACWWAPARRACCRPRWPIAARRRRRRTARPGCHYGRDARHRIARADSSRRRRGSQGRAWVISTACSVRAPRPIGTPRAIDRAGVIDAAVVGGCDTPVHDHAATAFNALELLPHAMSAAPGTRGASGLSLGEAARVCAVANATTTAPAGLAARLSARAATAIT